MKSKCFLISVMIFFIGYFSLFAQGFKTPSYGKAVVYFVRVTDYGLLISFEYFHQDKYIGIFKGKNYMRYECDPGEQLLWASSENKEFITTDLKDGGTYIVLVNIIMGIGKARVGFDPITANDERFERCKKLIMSKPAEVTPQEMIDKMNVKLNKFIPEQLRKYNEDWKSSHNFKHISADMAIPEEAMK